MRRKNKPQPKAKRIPKRFRSSLIDQSVLKEPTFDYADLDYIQYDEFEPTELVVEPVLKW